MGFFDFIRRLTGSDEDSKIKKIDSRISELHREKANLDKKLEQIKSNKAQNLSWFNLSAYTSKSNDIKVFNSREFGVVKTMKGLFEKRKREEEERLQRLRSNAYNGFESIRSFLRQEDVGNAESLLYQIAPILKDLKDSDIQENFDECKCNIDSLKEVLHQRELEKQEREAREKAERVERDRQEQLRKAEKAEKERQEKERKAREYEEKLAREEQARATEIARLTSEVTCKKENAQAILNHLNSHGVRCFYHFTDISNLLFCLLLLSCLLFILFLLCFSVLKVYLLLD